jgi:hypothetical protein
MDVDTSDLDQQSPEDYNQEEEDNFMAVNGDLGISIKGFIQSLRKIIRIIAGQQVSRI